jgi:hypothetical protein
MIVYLLVVIGVESIQFGLKSLLLLGNPCIESPIRSCKVWRDQILHRYPCLYISGGSRCDPHHIVVFHEFKGELYYGLNLHFFLGILEIKEPRAPLFSIATRPAVPFVTFFGYFHRITLNLCVVSPTLISMLKLIEFGSWDWIVPIRK